MNDYLTRFLAAPVSLKKSYIMLAVAWICHPVFIYSFFYFSGTVDQAESVISRMAVVSGCLAFLLFLTKKWARALVTMGNCFIVVIDLLVLAFYPTNKVLTLLCVVVILFTVMGTYWLFTKDSRDYYTQVNPKPETNASQDLNPGPKPPGSIQ